MADPGSSPVERLRSPASRLLLAAALTSTLVLGAGSLAAGLHSPAADSGAGPGRTATDEQTKVEVVEHAKQIVAIAALQSPTGGYLLMSCKNREDPPYQGVVYLDFTVPADARVDEYFRGIATAMVARGWREGLPPNQHLLGRTLSKDGVTATLYPASDSEKHGVAQIYGQCRDMHNHHGASTPWVDITDKLR